MTVTTPRDSTIAIVGDGFGSLMAFSTAVYLGFLPEEITIFGTNQNPIETYQQYAYNLGQTVLRSESESHFLPADWPTFAQLDAWSRKSLSPLFRSIRRKYNPGVGDVMAEATIVARRLGWNESRMPTKVGWVQRELSPNPHFILYDEDARFIGRARHVVLSLGHGPLSFPPVLAKARDNPALADRIVQAYEAKSYAPDGRYIVVGAGIAGLNEWVNGVGVGARVLSLLRSPAPDEQDLNTPRCFFEALGIDAYQGLPFEERLAFLGKILRGTVPHRRAWLQKLDEARNEARFAEMIGEIDAVEAGPLGLRVHISTKSGQSPG
ncbi:MAG: hypothetical protein ABR579_06695, partial [Actinomycetota bacterium]